MTARLRIGCSSWTSEAWWGKVYAPDLPPGERLSAYARAYDTVEVDASYYRAPSPAMFRRWRSVTPDGFVFAVKVPRDLLDPKRGLDREGVASFLASAGGLGPKLGPLLLQFPPWFKPGRATAFLEGLLEAIPDGVRAAVELRDAGWFHGPTFERLRERLFSCRIALTWSYLTYLDVPPERTSEFAYVRFIGDHTTVPAELHGERRVDRLDALRLWAGRLRAAEEELSEAFAFFNNHFEGFAPDSINAFRRELGLPPVAYGPPRGPVDSRGPGGSRQRQLDVG